MENFTELALFLSWDCVWRLFAEFGYVILAFTAFAVICIAIKFLPVKY